MSDPNTSTKSLFDSRVLRVFISSTFADMQAERDELVRFIFPELRKLCEQRQVTWGEVDLRWGIPEEQKAEGKVLPICLEEIKRCRPYFIGILGERYGWIPDEIPAELIAQEQWLAEHRAHSVTELEILHGVLRNPDMSQHAFFYFRDPKYIQSLPADKQSLYRDSDPERQRKLAALKQSIRKKGFPVAENYPHPKEFGQLVLRDMKALIDRLYPDDPVTNLLDREAADHEAFAESRRRVYVGGDKYFKPLDAHATGDGLPLVILGESGSGKSALLANWAARYRQQHPDELMILHFVGAASNSTDWTAMLRRIMGEFKRRFYISQDIPDKPDELRSAFANFLHMAAARGKVVLILDALNQLEDRDQALDLVWLPPVIPANIRLMVSTLPGRSLDDLTKRNWPVLKVEPLSAYERQEFITKYLAQYSRALGPKQLSRITSAEQTANPLYLRALLEELRIFGIYEQLDHRMEHYLAARTIPELYGKILTRWEEDYEGDSDLVGDAMSLIWASRRGLSESELLDMLGSNGEPLARAVWSPLFLAASDSLVSRSGLLGFFHDYLRVAVRDTYIPTEKQQRAAHIRVADYFAKRDLSPRKIDEYPWQLSEAKEWKRLYDLLADLEFFAIAWEANEWEVKTYWAQVEKNSDLRMVTAYSSVIQSPEHHLEHIWNFAVLLRNTGHPLEAQILSNCLVEHYRAIGDKNSLSASLGNQALILYVRGDLDGAMALLKQAEQMCRELRNKNSLQNCLGIRAVILQARGDLDGAMALHKQEEQMCRELRDKNSLQSSLGNQALILKAQGDLDGAMALHKQQEQMCRELGNKDGLQRSLGNQALILYARGDLDGAMALHKQVELMFRELGNKDSLQNCLGNQALILYARGDLDGAMALHKQQEQMCRELGNKDSLQNCLGNQALILYARDDLDGAMALLKQEEQMCRELRNKNSLQNCLGNQAVILQARGDLDGAMALHKQEEQMCRELVNPAGLARCLASQAFVFAQKGQYPEAISRADEAKAIATKHGYPALIEIIAQIKERISISR